MPLAKSQMITYNIEEHQNQYEKASFLHMLDIEDEQCYDCNETRQLQLLKIRENEYDETKK